MFCQLRLMLSWLYWFSLFRQYIDYLMGIISDCWNIDTMVTSMFIAAVGMGAAFRGVFIPFQTSGWFFGWRWNVRFWVGKYRHSFSTYAWQVPQGAFHDTPLCDRGAWCFLLELEVIGYPVEVPKTPLAHNNEIQVSYRVYNTLGLGAECHHNISAKALCPKHCIQSIMLVKCWNLWPFVFEWSSSVAFWPQDWQKVAWTYLRYRPDASLHSRVLAMRGKAWEPATTHASLASAGYITRELLQ